MMRSRLTIYDLHLCIIFLRIICYQLFTPTLYRNGKVIMCNLHMVSILDANLISVLVWNDNDRTIQ